MTGPDPILESLLDRLAEKIAARLVRPQQASKLLSVPQAGARVGRTAAAIRHLINSGEIPNRAVKRFGRRVFLITEELDRWVDAQ